MSFIRVSKVLRDEPDTIFRNANFNCTQRFVKSTLGGLTGSRWLVGPVAIGSLFWRPRIHLQIAFRYSAESSIQAGNGIPVASL
jgi:hypothetical protein